MTAVRIDRVQPRVGAEPSDRPVLESPGWAYRGVPQDRSLRLDRATRLIPAMHMTTVVRRHDLVSERSEMFFG